ncbi:uncharacterized SAM-binding protein YcdF (DUF218 family) [Metabacillus crassostreae]|nr:YdcF family protein [Metabacillus crassostreae]MBM7602969.1 uncharacterized SAM-binding protein YcdF (DUF218 family) [Metabacillus crassostreae]
MSKKNVRIYICSFLLLFITFTFYSAYSIWSFSKENQLVTTDAAIVLGAAVWNNEPSPVFKERINHSIWLYENEYVEKLIFTGGSEDSSDPAESEVARDYAIKNNFKKEDILIENESRVTEENLKYAYKIASEKNLKTFTIVSDPLHMKRAIFLAKENGMEEVYSSPTPSSVYKSYKSKFPFFLRELCLYVAYIISSPFR